MVKGLTFNLRWSFGLAGFTIVAGLATAFAIIMTQYLSAVMLEREVVVTREFLQGIVTAEALDAGTFTPGKTEADSDLGSFVDHIKGLPETLRVSIYAQDRSILWSTDTAMTGRRFEGNDELEAAFNGQTLSEIVDIRHDAKPEHVELARSEIGYFIEAYIPLLLKGRVIAVVEIYQAPVSLDAVLRRGQHIIGLGAAASALILFGTLFWIVVRAADVIERQRGEISRMEAQAALGQMAGGIAHNLRNPMAGIRSSAELMRLEYPEVAEAASDIMGEVDRLERCVSQLLEFTRTASSTPRRIDPLTLVEDAVSQQQAPMTRHGITVTIDDDRRNRRPVEADPLLLGQALTTILVNAREAMPAGGSLKLRLLERSNRLQILCTDTGAGIPPDKLARIGEPFFTTKTHGLGLGVALARRIVEQFGGTLTFSNAAGGGAQVLVELAVV